MSAINTDGTRRNHWRSIQLEHFKPLTIDGVGIDSIGILLSPFLFARLIRSRTSHDIPSRYFMPTGKLLPRQDRLEPTYPA
jgi:hypothetical protein